jgi:hypothetical protein
MIEGTIAEKFAADGSLVTVVPLTFGRARITISKPSPWMYQCIDDAW